jgi:dsDNA-specific endonuclease/ATPase MutS2
MTKSIFTGDFSEALLANDIVKKEILSTLAYELEDNLNNADHVDEFLVQFIEAKEFQHIVSDLYDKYENERVKYIVELHDFRALYVSWDTIKNGIELKKEADRLKERIQNAELICNLLKDHYFGGF